MSTEAGAKRKRYAVQYLDLAGDSVTGMLRVYKPQTGWWLAKSKKDWAKEVRITECQYDTAIKKLVERNLVTHRLYKFNGTPTCHIQLRIDVVTAVLQRIVSDSTKTQNPFHKNAECGFGGAVHVRFSKRAALDACCRITGMFPNRIEAGDMTRTPAYPCRKP